jgi:Tol biopolymer transport system component
MAWSASVLALIVAIAALAMRSSGRSEITAAPETRTEITTNDTTDPYSFALSPDGRFVVYVASDGGSSRLWLRPLASMSAQPLAGTEGATYPFWSPDSRAVAFFSEGNLRRLAISGGTPQLITRNAGSPRGGTWNAEGIILLARNPSSPLSRISVTGGEFVNVTTLDRENGQSGHSFPQFPA